MYDEDQDALVQLSNSKEFKDCQHIYNKLIRYNLCESDRYPFIYFLDFINQPTQTFTKNFIESIRGKTPWYDLLKKGILNDVEKTLTGVQYHFENIESYETALYTQLNDTGLQQIMPKSSAVGMGGVNKIDFEYQAFVISYRICLDKITKSVFSYFKDSTHSFRKFEDTIAKKQINSPLTFKLLSIYRNYRPLFEFVISENEYHSTRDKMVHVEYVDAGCLNLTDFGIQLIGGGEKLFFDFNANKTMTLTNVLNRHLGNLKKFNSEIIIALVDGFREEYQSV